MKDCLTANIIECLEVKGKDIDVLFHYKKLVPALSIITNYLTKNGIDLKSELNAMEDGEKLNYLNKLSEKAEVPLEHRKEAATEIFGLLAPEYFTQETYTMTDIPEEVEMKNLKIF